jgi:hypothetical protein
MDKSISLPVFLAFASISQTLRGEVDVAKMSSVGRVICIRQVTVAALSKSQTSKNALLTSP